MLEGINNKDSTTLIKPILILLGAMIFATLFARLINEITPVLIHVLMGRSDINIYLHLFEWTHTVMPEPFFEPIWWELGIFINLLIVTVIFMILRWKRNHYFLPLLMWAPLAYIFEGYGILTTFMGIGGSWGQIIALGFPGSLALVLGIGLFLIGIFLLFLVLPLPYNVSKTKLWKIFLINIIVFPFWNTIIGFYSGLNPSSIVGTSTAIIITIGVSLAVKPLFPILNRYTRTQKHVGDILEFKELRWSAVGLSCGLAIVMMLIFIFTPYEPSTFKGFIANTITLVAIIIISIILSILILYGEIGKK